MPLSGKTGEFIMSIMEQITEILVETFSLDPEEVTADARLEADLGINSLELAELALRCDEEFDVEIDDEDNHLKLSIKERRQE